MKQEIKEAAIKWWEILSDSEKIDMAAYQSEFIRYPQGIKVLTEILPTQIVSIWIQEVVMKGGIG